MQAPLSGTWILEVRNDTGKDVIVETIQLFRGEMLLPGLDKPKANDDWRIPAGTPKQLWWSPNTGPIMTLESCGVAPDVGIPTASCWIA